MSFTSNIAPKNSKEKKAIISKTKVAEIVKIKEVLKKKLGKIKELIIKEIDKMEEVIIGEEDIKEEDEAETGTKVEITEVMLAITRESIQIGMIETISQYMTQIKKAQVETGTRIKRRINKVLFKLM